jgi:hypothetical protein
LIKLDAAQQWYIYSPGKRIRRKSLFHPSEKFSDLTGGESRAAVAKNKKERKKKKKDAQLVLRLESSLRDEFIDACEELDTSAAREVRRFIKRFLKRYEKGEFEDLR